MTDRTDDIAAVREDYSTKVDTVRADTSLSDQGRQQRLAELYVDASDRVAALEVREDEAAEVEHRTAVTSAFAAPDRSEAATYRDALDRTEAISSTGDASALLERAVSSGDKSLARAVAKRATEKAIGAPPVTGAADGWLDVVDAYVAAYPQERDRVQRAVDAMAARERSRNAAYQQQRKFRRPQKPRELGTMTGTKLRELVDRQPTSA